MWPDFPDLETACRLRISPEGPDLDCPYCLARRVDPDQATEEAGPLFLGLPAHELLGRELFVVPLPSKAPFGRSPARRVLHVEAASLGASDEALRLQLLEVAAHCVFVGHVESCTGFPPP